MIALGLAFMISRFRTFARWSSVVVLAAALPAAISRVIYTENIVATGLSPALAAMRIIVQVGMIALIWWLRKKTSCGEYKSHDRFRNMSGTRPASSKMCF
jgi:uncharacterized membrane protein